MVSATPFALDGLQEILEFFDVIWEIPQVKCASLGGHVHAGHPNEGELECPLDQANSY